MTEIPAEFIEATLLHILEFLQLPTDWTIEQVNNHLASLRDGAPQSILTAGLLIFLFAVLRGLFAFLQTYWAEKNSQDVAFDLRNDLYAKISNLSFSYHDQNNTGQLMILATDDVEKVRLFIGQGMLQLVGAVVLLSGTLILLFTTNARLAVVTLWILPTTLFLFMFF